MPRTRTFLVAAGSFALLTLAATPSHGSPAASSATQARGSSRPAFTATYVSRTLGGGEPFVIYSHTGKDLVFSAHESTTLTRANPPSLLLNPGSSCDLSDPTAPSGFLCSYHNEVNVWYSTDNGKAWRLSKVNPLYLGFSDPSLTEDAGGRIYDTGIDLANDALFSSKDGGRTFPTGTPQCHEGDRPWLAGGKPGEVFLSTDADVPPGHIVYHSINAGASCSTSGIEDDGNYKKGTYSGFGQLLYDHHTGALVEPADFMNTKGSVIGVGISTLPHASTAKFSSSPSTFTPSPATMKTTEIDHWPAIAIDSADTTYVVWSTNPRNTSSTAGCSATLPNATGGPALKANSVMLAYSRNHGKTWSRPYTVAHPGTTVIWPWIVAGSAGRIAVTWYQGSQLTDPDCDSAALATGGHPTSWTVHASVITAGTAASSYPAASVDAIPDSATHPGGVLHVGGICQGGTTCLVTGQDRRLGDYFTNAVDAKGCLMIATGDTSLVDKITGGQFAQSRPLFVHQTSGPSLTAGMTCGRATATSSHSGGGGTTTPHSASTGRSASSNAKASSGSLSDTGLRIAVPVAGLVLLGLAGGLGLLRRRGGPPASGA